MNEITIQYVDLNKACSLLVAYWTLNTFPINLLPREYIEQRASLHSEKLEAMITKDRENVEKLLQTGAID